MESVILYWQDANRLLHVSEIPDASCADSYLWNERCLVQVFCSVSDTWDTAEPS
jgi:hypothetical protein